MNTIKQITQFIIGLLLLVVALFTIKYTFLLGILSILVDNIYKKRFINGLRKIGTIFTASAYCIDVLACVVLQVPLNYLFLKNSNYKFGSEYDSISYVLGINERDNTLSKIGKLLVKFLNFLDKDHCKNTVKRREIRYNIV